MDGHRVGVAAADGAGKHTGDHVGDGGDYRDGGGDGPTTVANEFQGEHPTDYSGSGVQKSAQQNQQVDVVAAAV